MKIRFAYPIKWTIRLDKQPNAQCMASNLSWLHACKVADLKAVAKAVGILSSGSKSLLLSRLLQHLPCGYLSPDGVKPPSRKQFNIISIDMGIRNLAYCRLDWPPPSPSADADLLPWKRAPIVSEWARIEISKSAPKVKKNGEGKVKEAFDPATFSRHAYDLVTRLLSSDLQQPTHILIERQRFRSMGGSAVQEWTLRVNMFEAMIYAVLKALSNLAVWQGSVFPVAPAQVSKFWLGDKEGTDAVGVSGKRGAVTKAAKIALVEDWLQKRQATDCLFKIEGKAEDLGLAYLRRRKLVKRVTPKIKEVNESGGASTELGKLDDLADCLLQGMAWIRWEQNRSLIMARGIKALDEIE